MTTLNIKASLFEIHFKTIFNTCMTLLIVTNSHSLLFNTVHMYFIYIEWRFFLNNNLMMLFPTSCQLRCMVSDSFYLICNSCIILF
jgi:hypothetical protein